jgi:GNAT superfamily N-acetyltransferase
MTKIEARLCSGADTLALRTRHREEMNCQIVHDSIHRRPGWTRCFIFDLADASIGFASVAVDGPWKDKPTLLEFYLLPEFRARAVDAFESFLSTSGARFFEVQTSEVLATAMALAHGRVLETEKIMFHDSATTTHKADGAVVRGVTPREEILAAIEARQGGGKWVLEAEGAVAGGGGILFHYNRPYGDLYMEVNESFRRRGFGTYLVQELKRACYELGAVPCARCSPTNTASLRTLQRAGFAPCAAILVGSLESQSI